MSAAIDRMTKDAALAADKSPDEVLPLLLAAIRVLDLRVENLESFGPLERHAPDRRVSEPKEPRASKRAWRKEGIEFSLMLTVAQIIAGDVPCDYCETQATTFVSTGADPYFVPCCGEHALNYMDVTRGYTERFLRRVS